MSTEAHNPLTQFAIVPKLPLELFGYNVSFTNASMWMIIACVSAVVFLSVGGKRLGLVPGKWQSLAETTVGFVRNMIQDNCGKEGLKFFPIVFTLFIFVLFGNMLGMLPYSFTVTSQLVVTTALAGFVFVGVMLIAIVKHGPVKFLKNFLPAGTPWVLAPVMYVIEIISFLARPISLSVRLCANMIVGHMILKIAATLLVMVIAAGSFYPFTVGVLPYVFMIVFIGFEIAIAILQAYIFTVLTCVYLNDALHLHH